MSAAEVMWCEPYAMPPGDPSEGKSCAQCHQPMQVGERVAASGWRHVTGCCPLVEVTE